MKKILAISVLIFATILTILTGCTYEELSQEEIDQLQTQPIPCGH